MHNDKNGSVERAARAIAKKFGMGEDCWDEFAIHAEAALSTVVTAVPQIIKGAGGEPYTLDSKGWPVALADVRVMREAIISEAACMFGGNITRWELNDRIDKLLTARAVASAVPLCSVCGQHRVACGENTACPGRMPR